MKRVVCCAILASLLFWLAGCSSFSALSGGSIPIGDIDGNVYLNTRATTPVLVPVELRSASGELLQQTTSNAEGFFSFRDVPQGIVEVFANQGALSGKVRFNRQSNVHARLTLMVAEVNPSVVKLNVHSAKPEDQDGDIDLDEDEDDLFTIAGEDMDGQAIPNVPVSWAVLGGIGEVSPDGVFIAQRVGDGELIVQHNGVSKHILLHVKPKGN